MDLTSENAENLSNIDDSNFIINESDESIVDNSLNVSLIGKSNNLNKSSIGSVVEDSFENTENNSTPSFGIVTNTDDEQDLINIAIQESLITEKNANISLKRESNNYRNTSSNTLSSDEDESSFPGTRVTGMRRARAIASDSEEEVQTNQKVLTPQTRKKMLDSDEENEVELNTSESESNHNVSQELSPFTKITPLKDVSYREQKDTDSDESEDNSDDKNYEVVDDDEEDVEVLNEKSTKKEETVEKDYQATTEIIDLDAITTKLSSKLNMEQPQKVSTKDDKIYCTAKEYSEQATKVSTLRTDVLKCKNVLRTVNLNSLPDRGKLLLQRQVKVERDLLTEQEILNKMVVDTTTESDVKKLTWEQLSENANCVVPKTLGKRAIDTYSTQKTLTMDSLKHLHDSLATCPDENTFAQDPEGLKVELMKHQKRALAWLVWREGQKPPGGILADDMGLGKTLTMISLILQTKEMSYEDLSDSDSENKNDKFSQKLTRPRGGTLVICPTTLIGQWDNEITKRVRRHLVTVEMYHGANRETMSKRLARYDIVLTTYKLVQNEHAKRGPLFKINWKRIILDEAHIVRNHKSLTSVAVCDLRAKTRWALTGTPVHNKELDLYALLKFLRCSPFDDLHVWKHWVANKSTGGQDRLNTVIQSLMLRRTKLELQTDGSLNSLPEKCFELINVDLDREEKMIYEKVLLFSQNMFMEYLRQRELKNPDYAYMRRENEQYNDEKEKYRKMHKKMLNMYGTTEIKTHQILVLLLRLRQICCHPSLITSMLEDVDRTTNGIEEDNIDIDIFDKLNRLNLNDDDDNDNSSGNNVGDTAAAAVNNNGDGDVGETFNNVANKVLNPSNPVFSEQHVNKKLEIIRKIIEEKVLPNDDKIVIVSQWTSMLYLIKRYLKQCKIKTMTLDGSVPVPKRNEIVTSINDRNHSAKVLLLSLTAGGVGLNLVGANHLLLVDLHWNPQLESQAQDRIYRFGQNKPVNVYKLVTSNTIEERIKLLQDKKLDMATDILSGTKRVAGSKLSLDDLKLLFSVGS